MDVWEPMSENSPLKIEISLSPRTIRIIEQLVKEGVFKSTSEAVAKIVEAHLDLIFEGEMNAGEKI